MALLTIICGSGQKKKDIRRKTKMTTGIFGLFKSWNTNPDLDKCAVLHYILFRKWRILEKSAVKLNWAEKNVILFSLLVDFTGKE